MYRMLRKTVPCLVVCLLFLCMLSAVFAEEAGTGQETVWPPEGKTRAVQAKNGNVAQLDGPFYYRGSDTDRPYYYFFFSLTGPDGGEAEPVTEYHVSFLSGDEHLRGFFSPAADDKGEEYLWVNWKKVTGPGTAEYRIDMASEHYWISVDAKPAVLDVDDYTVSLAGSDVYVPVGKITNVAELFELRAFVKVEPEALYDCRILPPGGTEADMETRSWKIDGWPYFTAKKAGDYDLLLRVALDRENMGDFPITIHASPKTKEAYIEGDAPPTLNAAKKQQEKQQQTLDWLINKAKKDDERAAVTETAGFLYRAKEGEALISRIVPLAREVVIPAELDGLKVRGIGEKAIQDEDHTMASLVVSEGIREIGAQAFCDCENLAEVTLPSTLERVGTRAFAGTAAAQIALPEGAAVSSPGWFCGKKTTDKTGKWIYRALEDGTAVITGWKYAGKLSIPAAVDGLTVTCVDKPEERTGKWTALTQLVLPDSLRFIGERAFEKNQLKELKIPAGVERIGDAAFVPDGKNTLKKVTFLGAKTELGKGIFGYTLDPNQLLDAANAGNSLLFTNLMKEYDDDPSKWQDYYAAGATLSAPELTVVCWPGSTADRLYLSSTKKNYLKWTAENVRTAPAEKVLGQGVVGTDETIYELIIPEGVEEIADGAFAGTALSRVSLPSTLKKIGKDAFSGCVGLTGIKLPPDLEEIGEGAFEGCTSLAEANLPDRITEVPDRLFRNCKALKKVKVQKAALTRIGEQAFENCGLLTDFPLKAGLREIGKGAFMNTGMKNGKVPDTVKVLGTQAFAGTGITALTLPAGLTEIPDGLCMGCESLKSVKIPAGVKRIGTDAFRLCGSLSGVSFPEGLEEICNGAFLQNANRVSMYYSFYRGKKKATSLKCLKLPASVRKIGRLAFAACDALTDITFAKDAQLEEIGEQAFGMCISLKELKLPDSLQVLGKQAFVNCVKMKKADLGGGLKTAGEGAFSKCGVMTSLTAPDTLEEIGANLLEDHNSKLKVTCGEGSAMEKYLQENYSDVTIVHPKKK